MQAVAAAVNGQKLVSGRGRYSRTRVLEHSRRIHKRLGFLRRYYSKQPLGTNEGSDLTRNGHVSALCKLKTATRGRCQSGSARSWRIVSQDQGDRPMSF